MLPSLSPQSPDSSATFTVSLPSLLSSVSGEFSSDWSSAARSFLSTGVLSHQNSRPSNPTPHSAALLSPFSPRMNRYGSASSSAAEVPSSILNGSCFGCWKLYDSVHHLPKIFTTCLHTTCSQCICDVSTGGPTLNCPIGNCPPIRLPDDSCQTMMNEVNRLPTNIPALVSSLIVRILSGDPPCDGPFCCENDHVLKQCSNKAVSLFRPKNLLVCADCFNLGLKMRIFDNSTNQPLNSLVHDETWLKDYLKENRKSFAECPTHPSKCIKYYCKTCHLGLCDDCLPQHQITLNNAEQNGGYFLHNVKYFDSQVLNNEVGFFRAYCRLMKEDLERLFSMTQLLTNLLILWQFKKPDSYGDQQFSTEGLLNEIRIIKGDFERLIGLITDGLAHCSAPELCSLRQWVRIRAYPLHVRTGVMQTRLEPVEKFFSGLWDLLNGSSDNGENFDNSKNSTPKKPPNEEEIDEAVDNQRCHSDAALKALVPSRSVPQIFVEVETSEGSNSQNTTIEVVRKGDVNSSMGSDHRASSALDVSGASSDFSSQIIDTTSLSQPNIPAITPEPAIDVRDFPRQRLYFTAKIGQAGEGLGEFTEPSGLAVTRNNELVVADSNSHRVQIFTLMDGRFVTAFGHPACHFDSETSLFFPNRVAVSPKTGSFYLTERAPLKLVQVFDSQYRFVRRFAVDEIQHPRAICCDYDGNVIVLQGLVMTVTIYSPEGEKLKLFSCLSPEGDRTSVSFPTAMCVSKNKEIFISDNTKHSIFVYSYDGELKRIICPGTEFVHYPIGLALNHREELVVCDNHETFNITLFKQDGTPIRGFQSQVKHSGVFDCCLVNEGRAVAMSCRDYKVYIYQYELPNGQPPPIRRFATSSGTSGSSRSRTGKKASRISLKVIDNNK